MIQHVLRVAQELGAVETVVVVPPHSPELQAAIGSTTFVEQQTQLGTGHAVLQARDALLGKSERVVVLYGDGPLIQFETVTRLLASLDESVLALLTVVLENPTGYGRIVRSVDRGEVLAIVEEDLADPPTRAIQEVWSGQLAVNAEWLWAQLPTLPLRPKGEYYLTDLVERAQNQGRRVSAVATERPAEAMGINTQAELAQANRVAWDSTAARLMARGVTILDPRTTYVEPDVEVSAGTVIHPNTYLQGRTRIGVGCQIGPNSTIVDSIIGDHCRVWASVVEASELEPAVQLGPFSHVRPGCYLETGVQLGNYAETKASRIGRDTQIHHFSYVGDARLGENVNVGAGTITCNFDGKDKHTTLVGNDVFLGSDSLLVAPVAVGDRARTGAGAVVTRDVDSDVTVVGVPARPILRRSDSDGPASETKDGD
jgi:bifunctional UDP-N-acetylglucosamine pyrophosphorylase/glucosamine-1-phosphate N-acetyltransferase